MKEKIPLMFSQDNEGILTTSDFLLALDELSVTTEKRWLITDNKKVQTYNLPAAFDIETSSFFEGDSTPENKRAIMYHWQFGIWNLVTAGRTWEEYVAFMNILSAYLGTNSARRLLVYVHNLPYEFFFMHKWFQWEKVFFLKENKPVYARTDKGIEYRCSMKLSGGKSLAAMAKDLQKYKVEKMVGDLDYNLLRTPLSVMTEKELKYCENDIRVITSYIEEKIEHDGDITRIPLTNTAYVRNYCRKECNKNWKKYRSVMDALTLSPEHYQMLKLAFAGGFTHSALRKTDKVLNGVHSFDFTSSYPAVMLLEQFPMSVGKEVLVKLKESEFRKLISNYCCIFTLEVWNIVPRLYNEFLISESKCLIKEGVVASNGRVVTADHISVVITEQDFVAYELFYSWTTWKVHDLIYYEKKYLPKDFALAILKLYEDKTLLKGDENEIVNYMIAKNMLNAGYGMMVTDPVKDEYNYDVENLCGKIEADVKEAIDKYNKSVKRFLYYPWGVWVTAYARANLWSGIRACGDDYIYSDTDSIKLLNLEKHQSYFNRYNSVVLNKIDEVSDTLRIDRSKYAPTIKGKTFPIGVWDYEGRYDKFKTLGAKRYLWERYNMLSKYRKESERKGVPIPSHLVFDSEGNLFQLTVAGANKVQACQYLVDTGAPFDNFTNSLVIPKEKSGRKSLLYRNEEVTGSVVDYMGVPYEYHEKSFIHMENTPYELTLSRQFDLLLQGVHYYED